MQATSDHDGIIRWLAKPEAYPHRPQNVEQVETHISDVFVAGELVYKLKKPVKYDFLDYTTLQVRACVPRRNCGLIGGCAGYVSARGAGDVRVRRQL